MTYVLLIVRQPRAPYRKRSESEPFPGASTARRREIFVLFVERKDREGMDGLFFN